MKKMNLVGIVLVSSAIAIMGINYNMGRFYRDRSNQPEIIQCTRITRSIRSPTETIDSVEIIPPDFEVSLLDNLKPFSMYIRTSTDQINLGDINLDQNKLDASNFRITSETHEHYY